MLLELAVADAFGAGFEYAPAEFVREHNTLQGYVQNPSHVDLKPGRYTDDTQMSIAIAEAIVSGKPWTREMLAEKFVEVFKRDPRAGYSKSFDGFLRRSRNGTEFLQQINATSDRSGAAMRAIPLGVFGSWSEVVERATVQAKVTHNTSDGVGSAVAAALLSHYCIYNLGPINEAGEYLQRKVPACTGGAWNQPWLGHVGSKGWMAVRAAITAVSRNTKLSTLLKDCIDFVGDVDTVATIALGAASESQQYEKDLPEVLIHGLEVGRPYGPEYLRELDRQLKVVKIND
jgi:ADP-ribosylglycohydrolase